MPVKKSVGWADIDDAVEKCDDKGGQTDFPDRTYEDGVKAGIEWVVGLAESHPLDKGE
jgi:hypothetical protein